MMRVDFRIAHCYGFHFVYEFLFKQKNMVKNPKKIFTEHKLNQVVK